MKKILFFVAVLITGVTTNAQYYIGPQEQNTETDSIISISGDGTLGSILKEDLLFDEKIKFSSIVNDTVALYSPSESGWDTSFREVGNFITSNDTILSTYSGYDGSYEGDNVYVGLTYSTDGGETFVRGNNEGNIIPSRSMEDPYLVKHNGKYYLYAEDKEDVPFRNIRLFTSFDLINWTDEGDVLDIGTGWESQDVSSPTVVVENDTFYLFYEGRSDTQGGAIGVATSSDGINFTKSDLNPIFSGTGINSDSRWAKNVVPDDIKYLGNNHYMIYHGYDTIRDFQGFGFAKIHVGEFYESEDIGQILVQKNYNFSDWSIMYSWRSDLEFVAPTNGSRYIANPSTLKINDIDYWISYLSDIDDKYVATNPNQDNSSSVQTNADDISNISSFYASGGSSGTPDDQTGFLWTISVSDQAFGQIYLNNSNDNELKFRRKSQGTLYSWYHITTREGNNTFTGSNEFTNPVTGVNATANDEFVTLGQMNDSLNEFDLQRVTDIDNATTNSLISYNATNNDVAASLNTTGGNPSVRLTNSNLTDLYLIHSEDDVLSVTNGSGSNSRVRGAPAENSNEYVTLQQMNDSLVSTTEQIQDWVDETYFTNDAWQEITVNETGFVTGTINMTLVGNKVIVIGGLTVESADTGVIGTFDADKRPDFVRHYYPVLNDHTEHLELEFRANGDIYLESLTSSGSADIDFEFTIDIGTP